jgi:hypothetical protein
VHLPSLIGKNGVAEPLYGLERLIYVPSKGTFFSRHGVGSGKRDRP